MSNADGGVIVVGIATENLDGVDVASALRPLRAAATLRNRLTSAISDMLDPARPEVAVHLVADTGTNAGYLIIDVPRSDRRPHMALPEKVYFRRGSDGTRKLDHGEVRDLILAPREGVLELKVSADRKMVAGSYIYNFDLALGLRNSGETVVRAPYLRLKGIAGIELHAEATGAFTARTRPDGRRSFVAGPDTLLHPDDEVRIAKIATGIAFSDPARSGAEQADAIMAGRPDAYFTVGPGLHNRSPHDETFTLEVEYGAENVRITTPPEFFFGRREALRLFRPHLW